ncbi:kinase-like domain-containing protein, partial [Macrophomina phaseolina]
EGIAEEIKRLKSLDHRHVINVVGTYQAANEYGILMCPVGDQDLEAFFTQLDNGDEQRHQHRTWLHGWLSCLASAVGYIHDHGLLHKEIAPKNIIHRGSEVYFTDFGLTTSTVSDARTTTAYAAPEIERIECQHTRSSDLFSLGCVYLEIL